jgi:hypothetical protein
MVDKAGLSAVEHEVKPREEFVVAEKKVDEGILIIKDHDQLREYLGLPEKSPLSDLDEIEEISLARIYDYIEELKKNDPDLGFGNRDRGRRNQANQRDLASQSITRGLNRQLNLVSLRLNGVKEAKISLKVLEERVPSLLTVRSEQVNGLKKFTPEKLKHIIDTIHLLGFNFSAYDLKKPELINLFERIAAVDATTVDAVIQQIDSYVFFTHGLVLSIDGQVSGCLQALVGVMEKGGLTEDQRTKFDIYRKLVLLSGNRFSIPIFTDNSVSFVIVTEINWQEFLSETQLLSWMTNALTVIESVVVHWEGDRNKRGLDTRNLLPNLIVLEQRGILEKIAKLTQLGWDVGAGGFEYGQFEERNIDVYSDLIDKALRLASDEEKYPLVELFVELMGESALKVSQVERYQQLLSHQEKLKHLALLIKSSPQLFDQPFLQYLTETTSGLDIDYPKVIKVIGELRPRNVESLSSEDKKLIEIMQQYPLLRKSFQSYEPEGHFPDWSWPAISFLATNKSNLENWFDEQNNITSAFVEVLLTESTGFNDAVIKKFINNYNFQEQIKPEIFWANSHYFLINNQRLIVQNLPEEFVDRQSIRDRLIIKLAQTSDETLSIFALNNKAYFDKYISDGKLNDKFFGSMIGLGVLDKVAAYFDEFIEAQTLSQKRYWTELKAQPLDVQRFMLTKPISTYFNNEAFDENRLHGQFLLESRVRPELCSTYESLTTLFNDLGNDRAEGVVSGGELGLIYLKIAGAHRMGRILSSERTEVEGVEPLRAAFSSLYSSQMTSFEQMSWKILQRQLPFTANEQHRAKMRHQAEVVESLDMNPEGTGKQRLRWLRQAVHNQMSLAIPDYLRAFTYYLDTGDKTRLEKYQEMFRNQFGVYQFSDEDREDLLAHPNLREELDQLILDAGIFYEVSIDGLLHFAQQAELQINMYSSQLRLEVVQLVSLVTRWLENDSKKPEKEKEIINECCLKVNQVRGQLQELLKMERLNSSGREKVLLLDTALDDASQKIFSAYKDYLVNNQESISIKDGREAIAILAEIIKSASFNQEVPSDLVELLDLLTSRKSKVTNWVEFTHLVRTIIPVLKKKIDYHWKMFGQQAVPEMISMLERLGLTPTEALGRVVDTDIVDFRKSSTVYIVDPIIKVLEEMLKQHETRRNPQDWFLDYEPELRNPLVQQYIDNLSYTKQTYDTLNTHSHTKADRLARALFPEYYDTKIGQRKYVKFGKQIDGQQVTVELFPYTISGREMMAILANGQLVNNPDEFLIKQFSPVKAAENATRDRD